MSGSWRAQDIPDAILGRDTRPRRTDDVLAIMDGLNFMDTGADTAIVMWFPVRGGVQPVIWPMRVHRHDQTCARG